MIKKIYLLFYLLFVCFTNVNGQTVLNTREDNPRIVKDPNSIILTNGFHVSSNDISGVFRAKIGEKSENSTIGGNGGATQPHETTNGINFQDTKGELTVDASGAANYKVPIALPPGIREVAPQIALTYSSSGTNGIAGYGWNIVGISSINLVGSRIDLDGFNGPVVFNNKDSQYALDGQRLIKLEDGTLGTENYSNLKITVNNGNLNRPNYFTVYMADGSQAIYGFEDTERSVTEFLISKFIDKNGNTVNYQYESENGVRRIKYIYWGGNEKKETNYRNSIHFVYTQASRAEQGYILHSQLTNNKILKEVIVKTNNVQFRKYVLRHDNNEYNYQNLVQVQEFNELDEAANPIVFDYNSKVKNGNSWFSSLNHQIKDKDILVKNSITSGDFDGDGQIDFMTHDKLYLNLLGGNSNEISVSNKQLPYTVYTPILLVDKNGILNSFQSIGSFEFDIKSTENNVSFTGLSYSKNSNQLEIEKIGQFTFSYEHELNDESCNGIADNRRRERPARKHLPKILFNDFLGNGIPKTVLITDEREKWEGVRGRRSSCNYRKISDLEKSKIQILDIQNINNLSDNTIRPYSVNTDIIDVPLKSDFIYSFNDFDGDGIGDLYITGNTKEKGNFYRIYSIKILENGSTSIKLLDARDFIGEYKSIVYGDFNGDGKTDMFIANREKIADWKMYISTGYGHRIVNYDNFDFYYENIIEAKSNFTKAFYAVDFNNDGKDDFVTFNSNINLERGSSRTGGSLILKANLGPDSTGKIIFNELDFSRAELFESRSKEHYQLLIDYNKGFLGSSGRYAIIKGNNIWNGHYIQNQKEQSLLKTVTESNGTVKNSINYSVLGFDTFTYEKSKEVAYPNYVIPKVPEMFVVSEQTVDVLGKMKYKLFKYKNLVVNYKGLGALGFGEIAESSWMEKYNRTTFETKGIWNITSFDFERRNVKSKSKSLYGEIIYRGFRALDLNILSEINTSTYNDIYTIFSDKRYILLPESSTESDLVSGTVTTTQNSYDSFYNIINRVETKTANGQIFRTTTVNTLENSPNSIPYVIGRLTKEVSTNEAYGGIYTTQKEYIYSNHNLSKTKTTVQNKGIHEVDYTYDIFGNVITVTDYGKLINGQGGSVPRKIESTYDNNGRFVIKKKDIEGYETHLEYNLLGQVTKETDKFGASITTNYDKWGKLLQVTSHNSSETPITTTYHYERDRNGWNIISQSNQTKAYKREYFDAIGHNIKNTVKGFLNGEYVSTSIEYDVLGRKLRESEPYTSSPSQWTTYEYDYLLRPTKIINHTGLVATNSYHGLTGTTIEGVRSKKITKDAVGNTSQVVDNGTETINHTYYPHGGVKTTTYGSHVITTDYDVWGRRTYLLDPSVSATPYTYSHTAFDETKEEKTPEATTVYQYDRFGKVLERRTTGKTNIFVNYTYDSSKKGLLIKEEGTNEGNTFTNTLAYDKFFRISKKTESIPQFTFGKYYFYDGLGRIEHDESWTMHHNKKVQEIILEHHYNPYNGELNSLVDISKAQRKVVWKTNAKNVRGQVLNATLGERITVENTYDVYGNITNIRNKRGNDWLYASDYHYQVDRGLLLSRHDYHFNWREEFKYDNFDRLLSWSSPNGTNHNTYLTDGRIDENNQVGTYKYNGTAKYKKESIDLNNSGRDYYSKRQVQEITFDAFKRPLSIVEQGRGRVDFQYGIHGGRFRAIKRDEIANRTVEKFYSADGTIEIVKEEDGTTKIINYISSPYETPFIYVAELNASLTTTKEGYYYLGRDFQGSIMAIYDEHANVVERRLFDPWGSLIKVQDRHDRITEGENAKLIFLDRGYTGHEHFTEVGIIHMNGRIYDPVLKQFLSPDNFIQDPENSQSYNRYGYVWNNPLKYTDPSGELAVETAFIIGVAVGGFSYIVGTIVNNTPFNSFDFFTSAFMGGVSGIISNGIGTKLGKLFPVVKDPPLGYILSKTVMSSVTHAVSQGVIGGITNGSFSQSFSSALVSSIISSSIVESGNFAGIKTTTILFGTVSGGLTARLTGGNFWQGAAIGFYVSALNHAAHEDNIELLDKDSDIPDLTEEFNKVLRMTRKEFTELRKKYEKMYDGASDYKRLEILKLREFKELVKTGAKYDLKVNDDYMFSNLNLGALGGKAYYDGQIFEAQDFGNFNFGVAAKAAGYPLKMVQAGAGAYQVYSGTSDLSFISSWFDDPRDYKMIKKGYNVIWK